MSNELAAPLDRLGSRPITAAVLGALHLLHRRPRSTGQRRTATAAVFRCVYALPVLWFRARAEERFGPRAQGQRRLAIIAGLFFAADLVAWHYAIQMVGAGLATVLGNTQVVFVAIAAWLFFGERLTARLIGALVIALGRGADLGRPRRRGVRGEPGRWCPPGPVHRGRVRGIPPRPAWAIAIPAARPVR